MANYNIILRLWHGRVSWLKSMTEKSRIVFRVRFYDAIAVVHSALRVRLSFVPRRRNGYNNIQQYVVINELGLMMGHLTHGMSIVTVGGRRWERLVAGTRLRHVESPKTREDFGHRGSVCGIVTYYSVHYNNVRYFITVSSAHGLIWRSVK